ncbi:hypothetical protein BD324DRAFT_649495 [Kockovaella imperatae]|uniref:Uncharacterized protein n=1 Tax=Kockovaella imperatae TaxID=4999 RepID=A0A1Y1UMZ1_9TREE|nr:hypothetical protein BD324DRAFT_649495 [Kockovaella imperatae]ORX39420.1 hypothetical protein BD324DRAFT_649495 [Kockovaella imperatae]
MSRYLHLDAPNENGFGGFLKRQFTKPKPLPAGIDLKGGTAIITGGTSGLGLEAGMQLLGLGLSTLIITSRTQSRGEVAAAKLRTKYPFATVEAWTLDMTSYESIDVFARKCDTLPRIDYTILNVGFIDLKREEAPTGHEMMVQVNYYSTMYLTTLLVSILKNKRARQSRPPVLSVVGSDIHYSVDADPEGSAAAFADNPKNAMGFTQYGISKYYLLLSIIKLAEQIDSNELILSVCNPGTTKQTDFVANTPLSFRIPLTIVRGLLGRKVAVGASCYLDAVLVHGQEAHGSFMSDWTIKPFPEVAYTKAGKAFQTRLWDETMSELRLAQPKVSV